MITSWTSCSIRRISIWRKISFSLWRLGIRYDQVKIVKCPFKRRARFGWYSYIHLWSTGYCKLRVRIIVESTGYKPLPHRL
jgi:hypothetical protein